jgi:hypothetical protein
MITGDGRPSLGRPSLYAGRPGTGSHGFELLLRNLEDNMRGALLWFLGIPIPVIILLYLFHVI